MKADYSLASARGRWLLLATLLASGSVFLVGTAVAVILPPIQSYFASSVTGIQWSDYRDRTPERVAAAQAELFDLYKQGRLDPHIGLKLPLEKFADGLRALRDGTVQGKVILDVTPSRP